MPRRKKAAERSVTGEAKSEKDGGGGTSSSLDLIGEDLLQIILSKLPALTFASAACVNRSWNAICNRLLSRPKLSSAFSLFPDEKTAVNEVVEKVLSVPLRPHFAIVCVSPSFSLQLIHLLITEKLGSTTPVVTYESRGIIGRDALSDEFKEVEWDTEENPNIALLENSSSHGILLVVGFVPGLKVDTVQLTRPITLSTGPHEDMVDEFVMDIQQYADSVSGCKPPASPAGIIMFGGPAVDMKPVLDKLDYAMSMKTVIVGDERGRFLHRGNRTGIRTRRCQSLGVALVFVRDRNKPQGIGEIEFHVTLSTGLSPIGPTFKAAAVKEKAHRDDRSTWLTAKREQVPGILDGQTMLDSINDEIGDDVEYTGLYIGVTKRRKCSVGLRKVRCITSLAFHEVGSGDQEYLFVNGHGIRTGDSFRFYYSDSTAASSSCENVSENLRGLKQDGDKKEVFGGLIFSCCGRGESFFGEPNVDSYPFVENFPGVPLAGTFCCGEIARGSSAVYSRGGEEQSNNVRCCLHAYSGCYLVMSYTPPSPPPPPQP